MFKLKRLTLIVGCVFAVAGCTFLQKDHFAAGVEINPITRIKHSNASPKIMYLLGRYHQGKKDYLRAIAAYEKALETNPEYVEVLNGLGVVYAMQGKRELSLEYFYKAIELAPDETYLYNNLGYSLLMQGDEVNAKNMLEQALALDPMNEMATHNLAIANKRIAATDSMLAYQTQVDHHVATEQKSVNLLETVGSVAVDQSQLYDTFESNEKIVENKAETGLNQNLVNTDAVVAKQAEILDDLFSESDQVVEHDLQFDHRKTKIEISNGNGINGMAKQVSEFFKSHGFVSPRLTNHKSFSQRDTEIYYRTDNAQAAYQINKMLPKQAKLIETNELRSDIHVKVLLGKDTLRDRDHFAKKSSFHVSQNRKTDMSFASNSFLMKED